MSEQWSSRIRSALKLIGMGLVSFGIINIEESMGAQEAVMSIIGAVTILIGLFWSEKDHGGKGQPFPRTDIEEDA